MTYFVIKNCLQYPFLEKVHHIIGIKSKLMMGNFFLFQNICSKLKSTFENIRAWLKNVGLIDYNNNLLNKSQGMAKDFHVRMSPLS